MSDQQMNTLEDAVWSATEVKPDIKRLHKQKLC
jgi:hypothetical protein